MEVLTFTVLFLVTLFTVWILSPKKRPHKFPPGPKPVPLFGNAFQLGAKKHAMAVELEKTYGPVIGVQVGTYWAVFFNNPDDIREILAKPEFAGRYGYDPFHEDNVSSKTKGPLMSQGEEWQDVRRFTLKALRDFGFGKRSMESIIQEEAQVVIEELKKSLGKPIQNYQLFNSSVLNVIWALVAGERFKYGDERLNDMLRLVEEVLSNSFKGTKLLNFMFPVVVPVRKLITFLFPSETDKLRDNFIKFLQKTIDEHRATMQVGQPRDFIDSYLEESLKRTNKPTAHFGRSNDDSGLIYTMYDLFGAGSDTTSTTLTWSLFLLALHPEEQDLMYKELETVVGNRVVQLEDRASLPITEAVMAEIMRVSSLVSIGSPHATNADVTFKNYKIPKNTIVLPNLYAAHLNKESWGDPKNFRPSRFLSEDKKTFVRHPHLMPFGFGKRQCLGETLSRDEFFVFLTNIVQQLKITMPGDEPKHTLEGQQGIVLTPEPHRIILFERN